MTLKPASELSNRGLIHRILIQVNDVRRALAIGERKLSRLPKAIMGDSEQCVLARALSNGWHPAIGGGWAGITLTHEDDGSVDWQSAKEALMQLGFEGVRIRSAKKLSRSLYRRKSLVFNATLEMDELIDRFDTGLLPHLILEDKN